MQFVDALAPLILHLRELPLGFLADCRQRGRHQRVRIIHAQSVHDGLRDGVDQDADPHRLRILGNSALIF